MSKKQMTEEERAQRELEKINRKHKRQERLDKFKDGLAEVGGAMLPIVAPLALMIGVSVVSSSKATKKQNEQLDLLAKGKGFEGRKDPRFVAAMYDDSLKIEKKNEDLEESEV